MSLVVWTARVGSGDPDALPIVRFNRQPAWGDRGEAFAPSVRLLSRYLDIRRRGQLVLESWVEFAQAYRQEMRERYVANRRPWDELLARNFVVLECFCDPHPDRINCHRYELARILEDLDAHYRGELERADRQPSLFAHP